jgi:cell division protein FtsL
MLRFVNFCLAAAVLVGACGLYVLKTDTRRLETFVQSQERMRDRLVDDVAVLRAERAHLARPDRLEQVARSLGLRPLDDRQLIRFDDIISLGGVAQMNMGQTTGSQTTGSQTGQTKPTARPVGATP